MCATKAGCLGAPRTCWCIALSQHCLILCCIYEGRKIFNPEVARDFLTVSIKMSWLESDEIMKYRNKERGIRGGVFNMSKWIKPTSYQFFEQFSVRIFWMIYVRNRTFYCSSVLWQSPVISLKPIHYRVYLWKSVLLPWFHVFMQACYTIPLINPSYNFYNLAIVAHLVLVKQYL
jgi:hypothetical protein